MEISSLILTVFNKVTKVKQKRKKIAIIGAGKAGISAALTLANMRDADGNFTNEVIVVDKGDKIFKGASSAAHQVHEGFEYPQDRDTAEHCLWGSISGIILLGIDRFFTTEEPMRFMVARESHEKPVGDPDRLTLEEMEAHCEFLKEKYIEIIDFIVRVKPGFFAKSAEEREELLQCADDPVKYKETAKRITANHLFGDPEDFYRPMTEEEVAAYGGKIVGGFVTKQRGFHLPRLMGSMEAALERQENITFKPNTKVEKVGRFGKSHELIYDSGECEDFDEVIQAAWVGGIELEANQRNAEQNVVMQVYDRGMAVVSTTGIDIPPPGFVLFGKYGAMFCPINTSHAVVYKTGVSDVSKAITVNTSEKVSPLADYEISHGKTMDVLYEYKKAVVEVFPFLENAEFVDLIHQQTINFQREASQRRHEPCRVINGRPVIYPTKATLAPLAAAEAVMMLEEIKQRSDPSDAVIGIRAIMKRALREPSYRIDNIVKVEDEKFYTKFARSRGMPVAQILEFGYFPRSAEEKSWRQRVGGGLKDIVKTAKKRVMGLGFGTDKVVVYSHSRVKTGRLFSKNKFENEEYCRIVGEWLESGEKISLPDAIKDKGRGISCLGKAIRNRVMCSDTMQLVQFAQYFRTDWKDQDSFHKLFGEESMARFPKEAWDRLHRARPDDLPDWNEMRKDPKAIKALLKNRPEIMALLLPIAFSILPKVIKNQKECADVCISFANMLSDVANSGRGNMQGADRKFFEPLAHPDANKVKVHAPYYPYHVKSIENNGRAIKINYKDLSELTEEIMNPAPKPDGLTEEEFERQKFYIEFQGKKYYPLEFHIHRTKSIEFTKDGLSTVSDIVDTEGNPDGHLEYKIYKNAKHERECIKNPEIDPNEQSVGELHAIFVHVDEKGQRKALALCAHIKLGEKNKPLETYTEFLSKVIVAPGEKEEGTNLRFNPIGCLGFQKFEVDNLMQTVFSSPILGGELVMDRDGTMTFGEGANEMFYNGVDAIVLGHEQSITISPEQLEIFRKQLPVFKPIGANEIIPLQRTI